MHLQKLLTEPAPANILCLKGCSSPAQQSSKGSTVAVRVLLSAPAALIKCAAGWMSLLHQLHLLSAALVARVAAGALATNTVTFLLHPPCELPG